MSRPLYRSLLVVAVMVAAVLVPSGTALAAPTTTPHRQGWSGACHAEVDTWWPAQHRAWAHRIVHRESRGIPSAANRRSSARGCFQMLLRYSSPFYRAVGCSNAQWMVARCNVRAALVMFQRHGSRPWRL